MPHYIVRQPNGLLAEFSTIVDHFTALDMTEAEAIEHCREHMGRKDAEAKVRRGVIDEDVWRPGSGPGSGHDRWDAALRTVVLVHGQKGLDKFRAEYPDVFAESPHVSL